MAKKSKATKATTAKLARKLTARSSGKAPETVGQHAAHAVRAIQLSSGQDFVPRGAVSLYLTRVAKVTKGSQEANRWIEAGIDEGLIKPAQVAA